jgi:hypothetical protein
MLISMVRRILRNNLKVGRYEVAKRRRASLDIFRGYLEFFIFINVILSNTWDAKRICRFIKIFRRICLSVW